MAAAERSTHSDDRTQYVDASEDCDPEGFPWLENGERMDQKTFHERYLRAPADCVAELIGGKVYVMSSPSRNRDGRLRHARHDAELSGCLFVYSALTPGTVSQNNATTILGDTSEPQPDSALLIRPEYSGQTRDGGDSSDFTYGAPELILEIAFSSRSIDLHGKLRDYERAGVREYLVYDLRQKSLLAFGREGDSLQPRTPDADGVVRSPTFPGLWLDTKALASGDRSLLVSRLQEGLASAEHTAFVAELEQRRAAHLNKTPGA